MTPLRQLLHTAALGAAISHAAVAAAAEPAGPPPPPSPVAAAPVAPAPVAVAPAPAKAASGAAKAAGGKSWLAARSGEKKGAATGSDALPSSGRLIGLALLLATLIIATIYLKRRSKGEPRRDLPKKLNVLASTRIGPKAHAVVLEVQGRRLLLGVTEASVRRLAFIDEGEEEEEAAREAPRVRADRRYEAATSSAAVAATQRFRSAGVVASRASAEPAPGSFKDLLKTAFKGKTETAAVDPAVELAEQTQDVVGGKPVTGSVRMVDVEGQAKGLLARLGGPRQ